MTHARTLSILAVLAMCTCLATASPPRFLRHPALSPDGREIAFVYQGDLWKVARQGGPAERLTANPAYEVAPSFSPDGKWIAFGSNRTLLYDTYVMPSGGGAATRLTWYDNHYDIPQCWTPDSTSLLLTTFRKNSSDLYRVSLGGETPVAVAREPWEQEYASRVSHDGKWIAYCRRGNAGAYQRWGYHGTDNADIYLADYAVPVRNVRRLTDYDGHDLWPQFSPDARFVYFASDRDGTPNVYRLALTDGGEPDGEPQALSHFTDGILEALDLSFDGKWLVFAHNFQIWTLKASGGEPKPVEIQVHADAPRSRTKYVTHTGGVSEYALSRDARKLALVVGGDVFITATDDNEYARPLTRTPWRECQPEWAPDNRRVVYASMRNGNRDLFIADAATGKEKLLWEGTPENESHPRWSPDGRWIAYLVADTTVVIRDETGEVKWSFANPQFARALSWNAPYAWSPDSGWLAFEESQPRETESVAVFDMETGKSETVSRVGWYAGGLAWSKEGRLLYGLREVDDMDVFALDPHPATMEFQFDEFDQLFTDEKKKPEAASGESDSKITFDFDDILRRARRLTPGESNEWYPAITPDGKTAIFISYMAGTAQIYTRSANPFERDNMRQRTSSGGDKGMLTVTADGKSVYYLNFGEDRVHRLELGSGKDTAIGFRAQTSYDEEELWDQCVAEAGWMLEHYFYDPHHHGADWPAAVAWYRKLVPDIASEIDLAVAMNTMFGELRASHLDVEFGPQWMRGENPSGITGIFLDDAALVRGEFVAREVEPESPATRPSARIRPGDRILSINGTPLSASSNWDKLLAGTVGEEVRMGIASPDGATRTAKLKPASWRRFWDLGYENWVEDRRERVAQLSDGRLGYLHIRDMMSDSLEQFKRDLRQEAAEHEGVVVDVRRNYGGNVAAEILSIVSSRTWAYTQRRGLARVPEAWRRGHSLERPSIVLINHQSVSNAEMFSSGYQALGLGKVVGIPTEGGVIFTTSYRLLNGFTIRRPFEGIYDASGENMEGKGREPDIYVDVAPEDYLEGVDRPLERAIKELLSQLDKSESAGS